MIKQQEIEIMLQSERITKLAAAKMLGVTLGTIGNYIKRGMLSKIKLGTSKQSPVYLKRDEVLKLLDYEIYDNPFKR